MNVRKRLSWLFILGILAAGSTALGYYYYFFYEPPLAAAETFMKAMEAQDAEALKKILVISTDISAEDLRPPTDEDVSLLLVHPFHRGRILDQRKRAGANRDFHYLVYREPDGSIYALLVTQVEKDYKVIVPERRRYNTAPYLWEYTWTN